MDIRPLYLNSGSRQLRDTDAVIVGTGITTAAGNLTISPFGSEVVIDVDKNISMGSGTGAVDLSSGSGLFKTTTGAVTIGPGLVTISGTTTFSAAGTSLSVTNNGLISGNLTVNGTLNANGGIERSSSGTITIGTGANTSAITIGKTGQLTTFAGDVSISGAETVVGATIFTSSATFDGDVVFGDAITDTVEFAFSRIKGSINLLKDQNHTIQPDQASIDGTGSAVTVKSGQGGTGSAIVGGTGGLLSVLSGNGGNGTVTVAAGAGGGITLRTGNAGTNNGAGGASSGILTLDVGTPTGSALAGTVVIGASAQSVNIGQTGKSTVVAGALLQSGGVFTLTGNGTSNLVTTAGFLNINGFSGINLLGNGTPALAINNTATLITVQAGATLGTTGTGNINLPNNGSARFQIESVAVSSSVTTTALNTVTNGSNADSYHTHTGLGASAFTATAGENLFEGQPIAMNDSTGAKAFRAHAGVGAGVLSNIVGLVVSDTASGNTASIQSSGQMSTLDARWDSVPLAADVGKRVYLSETVGKLTLTAPLTTGSTSLKVGILSSGGTGTVKLVIQIGEGITNG